MDRKTISLVKITIAATTKQNKPAKATVVNFGVSLFHLKVTEKTEKPIEEVIPNINIWNDFFNWFFCFFSNLEME